MSVMSSVPQSVVRVPDALVDVHVLINFLEEGVLGGLARAEDAAAHGQGEGKWTGFGGIERRDGIMNTVHDLIQLGLYRCPEEKDKFIAGKADTDGIGGNAVGQNGSDITKREIPFGVSVRIVNVFEVVDVNHDAAERTVAIPLSRAQDRVQIEPVEDVRQRILEDQLILGAHMKRGQADGRRVPGKRHPVEHGLKEAAEQKRCQERPDREKVNGMFPPAEKDIDGTRENIGNGQNKEQVGRRPAMIDVIFVKIEQIMTEKISKDEDKQNDGQDKQRTEGGEKPFFAVIQPIVHIQAPQEGKGNVEKIAPGIRKLAQNSCRDRVNSVNQKRDGFVEAAAGHNEKHDGKQAVTDGPFLS